MIGEILLERKLIHPNQLEAIINELAIKEDHHDS